MWTCRDGGIAYFGLRLQGLLQIRAYFMLKDLDLQQGPKERERIDCFLLAGQARVRNLQEKTAFSDKNQEDRPQLGLIVEAEERLSGA